MGLTLAFSITPLRTPAMAHLATGIACEPFVFNVHMNLVFCVSAMPSAMPSAELSHLPCFVAGARVSITVELPELFHAAILSHVSATVSKLYAGTCLLEVEPDLTKNA